MKDILEKFDKTYEGDYKNFCYLCCGEDYCSNRCGVKLANELKSELKSLISSSFTSLLEEMKKEIDNQFDYDDNGEEWVMGYNSALTKVLSIINKYKM